LGLFQKPDQDGKSSKSVDDMLSDEAAQRIRDESFYGQTQISLDEVERRLRQVQDAVGSPEDVAHFVRLGLNKLHCTVEDYEDDTFRLVLAHNALQLPGLSREIPRATFNPELGLDDPEVEVLDLGHPLVRRLMDLLKTETFQSQGKEDDLHYGRTAVEFTSGVSEMTVLYSLLVRFVTGTEPVQILEDILTVGVPLYGKDLLSPEQTAALFKVKPEPGTLSAEEKIDVLHEALEREQLDDLLEEGIRRRKDWLQQERAGWQERLGGDLPWLEGADQLEIGSWDLLAVKVLWPL
jgi:hypothetical protein